MKSGTPLKKIAANAPRDRNKLALKADKLLKAHFGEPHKTPRADPLDELILTILSQNTSDHNRDLAFGEFKRRFPTWEETAEASPVEIAESIRSGGLANQKSRRILDILAYLKKTCGKYSLNWLKNIPVEEAIGELTALKGVGIKTAAVVMCFSFEVDIFPVDVHVHRICRRLGFVPTNATAEKTHYLMQSIVPPGQAKALHLNMLKLGRIFCRPTNPDCLNCPLVGICPYSENM